MHAVVETPAYLRDAKDTGLDPNERASIVMYLAENPSAGVEIPGTGGARKVRFTGRGRGKSGGYRVVTFYSGEEVPVFLLNVFAKGDRVDLSQDERNEFAAHPAVARPGVSGRSEEPCHAQVVG
jgi:hypothetical protein